MNDAQRAREEAKRILTRAKQGAVPATMVPVWVLMQLIEQAERRSEAL